MNEHESTDGAHCSAWDNSGCSGTPHCPPRCPRFVDGTGEPLIARPYTDADFTELVGMYDRLAGSSGSMGLPPTDPAAIDQWLGRLVDNGWNLIVVDDDRIVGHVGVAPATEAEPEFVIFVDDAYQGRGIGTELVKQLVAYADDRDHAALRLTVLADNQPAITVYRNIDFDVTEEQPMDLGMRLPLDRPIADRVRRPPADR